MQCADMRGKSIKLKNLGHETPSDHAAQNWYFMIDTCESLAHVTGATDCVPNTEVRKMFHEFIVTTKTVSQFFSAKTYINNG